MENQPNIIRISVRSLVEFLLRSGSLDTQTGPSSEAAMLEGARIHRALQKKEGEGYRAEVPLRLDVSAGGAVLRLEGRADGIFFMQDTGRGIEDSPEGGLWIIDEIKTVLRGLGSMEGPWEVHLAQARCYAYMYARQESLSRVKIRMTYCSQATKDVRYFYEEMSFEALEKWFTELITDYEPWIRLQLAFEEAKDRTVREMVFPFPYREGQYELAAGVYRTIVHEKKLFLQAPTGTGKTMAVLFPALKAMGAGKAERIFYLTAKGVTGTVAQEALSILCDKGLSVRSLTLISRERACPCQQVDCRPEVCPRADGHFDRVNKALWELLQGAAEGQPMTVQALAECARRHNVCPYSLSLDAAEFADVIICDYNYVFHPQARLERFFEGKNRSILLIDEAHNLVERGRDMYSAQISNRQVRQFRRSIKNVWPRLWKKMKGLVHVLRLLDKEAASDDRKIRVLHDWTTERAEAEGAADVSKSGISADGSVNGSSGVEDKALETDSSGPVRRAELCHAVEEVRDQIQWILEQENRSAALHGSALETERGPLPKEPSESDEPVLKTGAEAGTAETGGLQTDLAEGGAGIPELLEFYFGLSHFSEMLQELDGHYIVYTDKGGAGGFSLHLYCADPSGHLRSCMDGLTSAIFFSATFLPVQYYKGLLGGTPEDYEMYARSSFSPGNRKVVIVRDVTSRYRDRNEENYERIARSIGKVVACRPGNYMVYFPSYVFLENVLDAFCRFFPPSMLPDRLMQKILLSGGQAQKILLSEGQEQKPLFSEGQEQKSLPPEKTAQTGQDPAAEKESREAAEETGNLVLAQKREMTDAERAAFLHAFEDVRTDRHLIGFCVLGGMFGEGIDLRSDRLIGSLIVGTGIPPVEPRRELLKEYFSGQGRNGYDFAYRFPGMNKVLQAAGRVIRTAEDVGVVVLMDGRFSEGSNRGLFPLEWGQPEAVSSETAAERIRSFWDRV